MAETLEVYVNRDRPNVLEVPTTFETTGNFNIVIDNEGQPVHLHLNVDDDLLEGLNLETGNHYIPRDGEYRLPVQVNQEKRPFMGKCRISIAYGSETRYTEIRVTEPEQPTSVQVDESLAEPVVRPESPSIEERLVSDTVILGLLFLAFLALIAGAVIVASLTTPLAGVILVVVVIIVAIGLYLLVEER